MGAPFVPRSPPDPVRAPGGSAPRRPVGLNGLVLKRRTGRLYLNSAENGPTGVAEINTSGVRVPPGPGPPSPPRGTGAIGNARAQEPQSPRGSRSRRPSVVHGPRSLWGSRSRRSRRSPGTAGSAATQQPPAPQEPRTHRRRRSPRATGPAGAQGTKPRQIRGRCPPDTGTEPRPPGCRGRAPAQVVQEPSPGAGGAGRSPWRGRWGVPGARELSRARSPCDPGRALPPAAPARPAERPGGGPPRTPRSPRPVPVPPGPRPRVPGT